MARKAMAYLSDVIIGRTGEVIGREAQREAIRKYAAENDIEVVAWFEDELYDEDPMARPGMQAMLSSDTVCDLVLVERVWSVSRSWPVLQSVLETFDRRGLRFEATATLWDCVSQQARHHFAPAGSRLRPVQPVPQPVAAQDRYAVRRPERIRFLELARRPHRS
jgi:hypothetical protein